MLKQGQTIALYPTQMWSSICYGGVLSGTKFR
jgi:hypothetical protein